jgi:dTDP-4-dehydrorhamnose 3,5-epimerase
MPFTFENLGLPGVVLARPRTFADARGFFRETFKASDFAAAGIPDTFLQDNLSFSRRGTVRGLHYQVAPNAQGKLVQCVSGRIWDVAVDIRPGSATFGQWVAAELTEEGGEALFIPEDFAHGFQVLSERALVSYKCTRQFDGPSEGSIRWNDPELAVAWPLPGEAVISDRDGASPFLRDRALSAPLPTT